jgi:hypothetical protein
MKSVPVAWFLQHQFVSRLYPQKTTFGDSAYHLVKKDWIFQSLYPFFRAEMERWGVVQWSKKFDCEDFARTFKVLAQACHLKSRGQEDGIAIGEIDYTQESGEYHCINVAFTDVGVVFMEPQSGKELKLTENEKNSINRFRI